MIRMASNALEQRRNNDCAPNKINHRTTTMHIRAGARASVSKVENNTFVYLPPSSLLSIKMQKLGGKNGGENIRNESCQGSSRAQPMCEWGKKSATRQLTCAS